MSLRRLILIALIVLVVAPPASAIAATYGDTVTGYEYYATSTDGRFAGTASGVLPGAWDANVKHTALCLSCTPTATITGGTFSLATNLHGVPTLVTGKFTGGTIEVTNIGAGCTKQTFAIRGKLARAGPWNWGNGSGSFRATLTHYRHSILGHCITYAASVGGTLSLSF
jgi:hypothetical protein